MKTREILEELEQTTNDFSRVLGSFTPAQINIIPFENSWTAGQVAEHILMSETGLPGVLLEKTKPAERPKDEKVPEIEAVFLDFTTKLQAPEFIIPGNGPHDKNQLLMSFQKERSEILMITSAEDLTQLCTSFPFPEIGELTRWEWVSFVICHSKRHIFQLQNILEKVKGK
ncbi:DinB family protein [Dyadobacter bucti]|uniref:DinB family protein n=1 Tax=Dyadobacter bucti TaxID=2572203 RepID=UPI00110941FB|nr:DinB family protein [Dyadobacter bucti]